MKYERWESLCSWEVWGPAELARRDLTVVSGVLQQQQQQWASADRHISGTVPYVRTAFAALRRCWLGDRKGIRPVKNSVVGCWRGYLSAARCRLAYGPADATATHCLLLQ